MTTLHLYVGRRWQISARMWLGVLRLKHRRVEKSLLTSPPHTATSFPYASWEGADIVYVRLHGVAGQPHLYDGKWQTALSLRELQSVAPDLRGARVFLEVCYGASTGLASAMLDLGARQVVASAQEVRNSRYVVGSAGRVGLSVVAAWLEDRQVDDEFVRRVESGLRSHQGFHVFSQLGGVV